MEYLKVIFHCMLVVNSVDPCSPENRERVFGSTRIGDKGYVHLSQQVWASRELICHVDMKGPCLIG